MFRLFYSIGINLYFLLVKIVSLYNKKAYLFIDGRKRSLLSLQKLPTKTSLRIWFHCASLGEFEQAKPIIEKLKELQTETFIAISFFSPSGFEPSKNYKHADWIGYLPKDSVKNAKKFIRLLQPDKVVFVKYEIWYFFLKSLQNQSISTYLISAKFRQGGLLNPFLKPYFLPLLKGFEKIYLQDKSSFNLLEKEGMSKIELSGDTRVDRVLDLKRTEFDISKLNEFLSHSKILIGGSTWQEEEDLLFETMHKMPPFVKLIIAPHDISRSAVILKRFLKFEAALFSDLKLEKQIKVLIIDNVGSLSKLYRVANIAFVGGGFSNALHNIYEPAVYGIPVLFGNNTPKFPEAELFVNKGMGFMVNSSGEIYNHTLAADSFYNDVKMKSKLFFEENKGVCEKITSDLLK